MFFYVYKITNKVNGKIYIGWSKNPQERFRTHQRRTNKSRLRHAMCKYGIQNFDLIVLEEHTSKQNVKNAEIRLIAEYKSQDPDVGYNMTSGGDGCPNLSEESIEKMRAAKRGTKASDETRKKMSNSQRGRVMSPEHCKNLSIATKKRILEKGVPPISEATRQKLSESSKGSKNPSSKLDEEKVRQIKTLLSEGSMTHYKIAEMFGVSRVTIGFIKNERLWSHVKLCKAVYNGGNDEQQHQ